MPRFLPRGKTRGRIRLRNFVRKAARAGGAPRIKRIICLCNFSPVVRESYRIGALVSGVYREILNSDSAIYGGSNVDNAGAVIADNSPVARDAIFADAAATSARRALARSSTLDAAS